MMSLVLGLKKTLLIHLEEYLVPLLCQGCPGLRWMVSDFDLLQRVLPFRLRQGIWNFHLSMALTLPLHWAFGRGVQMRPSAPILHFLRPQCLLSRILRVQRISTEYTWQDLWTELMLSRKVCSRNREIFYHLSKRTNWPIKLVLQAAFHMVSSHLPRVLEYFANSNCTPKNQPTIFHPSRIVTALQRFLLPFCALLLQQYHSSQIDEV